jgi:hypothetical protein
MIDEALTRIVTRSISQQFQSLSWIQRLAPSAEAYRVMVRIGLERYRGSFNTCNFGEKKPHIGFCQEGQLKLVYRLVLLPVSRCTKLGDCGKLGLACCTNWETQHTELYLIPRLRNGMRTVFHKSVSPALKYVLSLFGRHAEPVGS